MTARRHAQRAAAPQWLAALVLCAIVYSAWFPGVFTLDEADILEQALTGRVHDGHSPLIVSLWALAQPLMAGPAIPYLVGLAFAIAMAAALLGRLAATAPAAALALYGLILLPPVFVTLGLVTKDLFFVGAMLAVMLALVRFLDARRAPRLAVLAAAMQLAVLVRIDAAFALFPIAAWLAWHALRRSRRPRLAWLLAAPAAAAAILALIFVSRLAAHQVFRATPFHAEQVTMLFDLAAVSLESNRMLVPPSRLGPQGYPLPLMRSRFDPASADSLIWAMDGRQLVYAPDADHRELRAAWAAALAAHPAGYARFRAEYAARFLGIRNNNEWLRGQFFGDARMAALPGRGWRQVHSALQSRYHALSAAPVLQAVYLPWFWLLCAIVPLLVFGWRAAPGAGQAAALLFVWSALCYTFSMALVSASSIARYHSWPRVAIGFSLVLCVVALAGKLRVVVPELGEHYSDRNGVPMKAMKAQLRKIVRAMAGWPVIGRLLRIGVAVIRLPEFRAEYLARNGLSDASRFDDAPGRHSAFETEQLPTLLQTVSALNYRQLASDNDRENLVKSVPVALRRLGRDLADGRAELQRVEQAFAQQLDTAVQQLQHQAGQLDHRLDGAAADASARIDALSARLDGAANTLEFLLGRVEFVRRELMFEMRYGAAAPAAGAGPLETAGEILAPEKVAAARGDGLRLNLGCGHIALDGYLNVDRRALPGVDIVAEVDRLPFAPGELTEIFSAHLLEHFPQEQLRRRLLPYYFGLLKGGGRFAAVVPDAEAMLREYADGSYPYAHLREVLYGGQDYDGDFHFNMFTPASMSDYLREAGFVDVQVLASGRRNGRCYEFEIAACKPAAPATEQAG